MTRGGVAIARRLGLRLMVCLMPAPIYPVEGVQGIYTGARILACIYLATTNSKVGTKSFVLGCVWQPS